jgi:hypothetical protein
VRSLTQLGVGQTVVAQLADGHADLKVREIHPLAVASSAEA